MCSSTVLVRSLQSATFRDISPCSSLEYFATFDKQHSDQNATDKRPALSSRVLYFVGTLTRFLLAKIREQHYDNQTNAAILSVRLRA